jgi:hypothetical protein
MKRFTLLGAARRTSGGMGFVDAKSPATVELQIDRISAYQLDSATNLGGKPMLGLAQRGRVRLIRRGGHISNPGCASLKKARPYARA